MDQLFEAWRIRSDKNVSNGNTHESNDDNVNHHINKNDKNTLQSILMFNHKYQKREMNEDFLIKRREAKGTELLDTIAPFTTDKTKVVETLEVERLTYIQKRLKANPK
jgi:hypothetical protein